MNTKPLVTLTRKLTDNAEARLAEHFQVRVNTNDTPFSHEQLSTAMQNSDGLLCTVSDAITRDIILTSDRRTSIIANFGVGYSNIDIAAAAEAGVVVSNTPDVLTDATADIAMLLILAVTRRAYESESMLRQGQWQGFNIASKLGVSIQNKTLGVIGMGRIGQALARRAVLAFGMQVIYFNRSEISGLDFPATACASIEELMAQADVISLHVPGASGQGPVVTRELLSKMKADAFLINTARGDVIDENALIDVLQSGQIAGAGLDVYADEPQVPEELLALPNLTLLPHIGSATNEVRDAMGMLAIDNLIAHFHGGDYPSRVI